MFLLISQHLLQGEADGIISTNYSELWNSVFTNLPLSYFARENNDLRLTGGTLAVDKICIGDETRCFDITSLPSLTIGDKLITQYGQMGMHMFSPDPTDSYIFEIFDATKKESCCRVRCSAWKT